MLAVGLRQYPRLGDTGISGRVWKADGVSLGRQGVRRVPGRAEFDGGGGGHLRRCPDYLMLCPGSRLRSPSAA